MPAASLWLLRTLCRKVLSWAQQRTVNHHSAFLFAFFCLFQIANHCQPSSNREKDKTSSGITRRFRLLLANAARPAESPGSFWRKPSSTQEQHAASQQFASSRAPYGHYCLGNAMVWCIRSATAPNQNNTKRVSLDPQILTEICGNFQCDTKITTTNCSIKYIK